MIQLDLKDAVLVEGLHPLFPKAFDYLRHADFQKMEDGKHEIDGENLFCRYRHLTAKETMRLWNTIKRILIFKCVSKAWSKWAGNRQVVWLNRFPRMMRKRILPFIRTSPLRLPPFIPVSLPSFIRKMPMRREWVQA